MIFYRLVAIALLGIYAVPAAIGPHWHSHQHRHSHQDDRSHEHGHSHQDDVAPQFVTDGANDASCCLKEAAIGEVVRSGQVSLRDCPFEARRQAAKATTDATETSVIGTECDHGVCAVCQFYSLSQLNTCSPISDCTSCCTEVVLSVAGQLPDGQILLSRARGPPL